MQTDPTIDPVADPVKQPVDDAGQQPRPAHGLPPDMDPLAPPPEPDEEENGLRSVRLDARAGRG
ncbi:hypothetical protein [Paraburkholderia caribensis]|uniref:hypothetical protein n=1 Tax=Paraburkholderia caribensis TaxID=75105 RepID=UPI00071F2959|nr:hypothetical protein [Paraburkholderia caribensis]ALP66826.1 hypothetical protein AN416_29215 [Paraburkholderia caribensis]AUT56527.1 hypothetical protein C2L66_32110 [Paraburkholderia caribensis]